PSYHGKGLTRGGKLEAAVWRDFARDRGRLRAVATAILRASTASAKSRAEDGDLGRDDEAFAEGAVLERLHKRRERNRRAVERKKANAMRQHGRLACEACGFDFATAYGDLGVGFAECHHRVPLTNLAARGSTRVADLAILCANCHRMIHRTKPMESVEVF